MEGKYCFSSECSYCIYRSSAGKSLLLVDIGVVELVSEAIFAEIIEVVVCEVSAYVWCFGYLMRYGMNES